MCAILFFWLRQPLLMRIENKNMVRLLSSKSNRTFLNQKILGLSNFVDFLWLFWKVTSYLKLFLLTSKSLWLIGVLLATNWMTFVDNGCTFNSHFSRFYKKHWVLKRVTMNGRLSLCISNLNWCLIFG